MCYADFASVEDVSAGLTSTSSTSDTSKCAHLRYSTLTLEILPLISILKIRSSMRFSTLCGPVCGCTKECFMAWFRKNMSEQLYSVIFTMNLFITFFLYTHIIFPLKSFFIILFATTHIHNMLPFYTIIKLKCGSWMLCRNSLDLTHMLSDRRGESLRVLQRIFKCEKLTRYAQSRPVQKLCYLPTRDIELRF